MEWVFTMKTFNEIKIGDFLYVYNFSGLESKIDQYKVINTVEIEDREEIPDHGALILTLDDNENYTVAKSERESSVSVINGIYTELELAVQKLDITYKNSIDWINYLLSSYTEKVNVLKDELLKWKTLLMKK